MENISQPCIHLPLLRSYNLECFVTHSPKCSVGSSEHLISLTLMLNSPSFPLYSCGVRTKAVLFLVELSQSPWTHKTQIEAMHSSGKTIKHRRSYNGWEPESTIVVEVQRRKPLEPLKVVSTGTIESDEPSYLKMRPVCYWKRLTHILKSSQPSG